MKIIETTIPENSSLYPNRHTYNYVDSYEWTINDKNNAINIVAVGKTFIKPDSKWVGRLFVLRDKIVSVAGLKTTKDMEAAKQPDNVRIEPGERVGFFKVFSVGEHEIILGEDDKHLNFRVSLLLNECDTNPSQKVITVTTTVIFNNWVGQAYFLPVKPFHRLIVPITMKKKFQELELEINA